MMEREAKKRKLFQDVLPAEMIENIVLLCPNIITLQSLACTCKQINQLVAKTVNQEILLSFSWTKRSKHYFADYTLRSDGTAIKSSEYTSRSQGSDNQKSKKALKMLKDRDKLNRLHNEVLRIMNMTDTSKFTEIIVQYEDDPLFDLEVDEISIYIQIDNANAYEYTMKADNNDYVFDEGNLNPDLPPQKLSWNYLDEKMVNRLKCALCAIKIRDWFKTIPYMASKGQKSLSIEYREDAEEQQGWDLDFDDSGRVTGLVFEIDSGPWRPRIEKKIESIQLTPSFVEKTFVALEKYLNSDEMVKLQQKSKKSNEISAKERFDLDSEENDGSEEDEESDLNEESFEGRRTVEININGTTFKRDFLKAQHFDEVMKTIEPITRRIDTLCTASEKV